MKICLLCLVVYGHHNVITLARPSSVTHMQCLRGSVMAAGRTRLIWVHCDGEMKEYGCCEWGAHKTDGWREGGDEREREKGERGGRERRERERGGEKEGGEREGRERGERGEREGGERRGRERGREKRERERGGDMQCLRGSVMAAGRTRLIWVYCDGGMKEYGCCEWGAHKTDGWREGGDEREREKGEGGEREGRERGERKREEREKGERGGREKGEREGEREKGEREEETGDSGREAGRSRWEGEENEEGITTQQEYL